MPTSFFIAKKLATGEAEPRYFSRHFCRGTDSAPHPDYLFRTNETKTWCPECKDDTRFDVRGRPRIVSFYAVLKDTISRTFASPYVGSLLRYGASTVKQDAPVDERYVPYPRSTCDTIVPAQYDRTARVRSCPNRVGSFTQGVQDCLLLARRSPRWLCDAYDGQLLHDHFHDAQASTLPRSCLYMTFTCDGTEVEKNKCYTPIAAKYVNLPPQLRQLLGNIKLVGWMQPGVKDYQAHFRPFVRQLAKHQPGKTPMKVRIVRSWHESYPIHFVHSFLL